MTQSRNFWRSTLASVVISVGIGMFVAYGLASCQARGDDDVFHWRHVGANPCNPEVGCTLEWALAQAEVQNGWPHVVTEEFKTLVLGSAENIVLKDGWRGWMTEGWTADKVAYHPDTIADWPPDQEESAWAWRVPFEGTLYTLIHVGKCKNWGGYEELLAPLPAEKPEVEINLGTPPIVKCP